MGEGYDIFVRAHVCASKQAGEFSLLLWAEDAAAAWAEGPACGQLEGPLSAVTCPCLPCGCTGRIHICGVWMCLWSHGGVRPSVVGALLPVSNSLGWGGLAHLGCALALGLTLGRLCGCLHEQVNQLGFGESHQACLRGLACLRRLACLLALGCARLEFRPEASLVGGLALRAGELAPCVWAVGGGVVGSCHG